ncbi:uncharacterized protein TrAFT101_011252 [Trichoderma asperellum]|uniref:uncharacterized protein n=1 Tax=Trichoderma asperellum TaxID=101201 RepID=UPI003329C717|nr:hypothetical protein TrAFT101_011252 [Trichoderma asperellum]
MASVQDPSYLLAPNWTFRPNGSIALGNIIANPFRPQHVLFKPAKALSATETATENNWRLATEKIRSANVSIWARFLDQLNVELGAKHRRVEKVNFIMKSLDTIYFRDDPSIETISELANKPRVRSILNVDSLFHGPVYMVTGLKIAKGFKLTHSDLSEQAFTAKAMATVAPEVSVGAKAEAEAKASVSDGFEAANDIIFAYQLLRIKPKGWGKNTTLQTDDFRHKAAFLSDSDEDDEGGVEVETDEMSAVEMDKEDIAAVEIDSHQLAWILRGE